MMVFFHFSVFKIYNIEEDKFEEKLNLRVGKNLNLNFSSTDVAWNHIEGKDLYHFFNILNFNICIYQYYNFKEKIS